MRMRVFCMWIGLGVAGMKGRVRIPLETTPRMHA